ncbi:hypothetical protein [Papillibacter cinnamivorans]|uniref:Uncharacterized protein n=1 Tax=Papillibacter cinnamivorans DSM 12816 TaxID=1122930 RepID=A0A1W1ZLG3_9FIRM|nr:hypothetical protein [Papillibacter cinnamivorans]SMC49083.1 hypothetical protein SAMN02745168_1209 [Papillibacter cinnamivorans DSM 12816]
MAKKIVAPVVITVLLVVYFIFWLWLCVTMPGIPLALKIIGAVIPCALIGVSVFVLMERIKEVRSGEEDDLGKY